MVKRMPSGLQKHAWEGEKGIIARGAIIPG